jgi:hypothetical protein
MARLLTSSSRNCENVEHDQSGCNKASQGKQKNSEIEVEHA